MAEDPMALIAKDPAAAARWFQGLAANAAKSAGVDPVQVQVAERYGYLSSYLAHPEIGPILRNAAAQGWSPQLLQGAISNTNWWKSTTAAARELDLLARTDPSSYNTKVNGKAMELQQMAEQGGFIIRDWGTLTDLAKRLLIDPTAGEEQMRYYLFGQMQYDASHPLGGTSGQMMQQLKARSAAYFLPMSDEAAFNGAKRIAMGMGTAEGEEKSLIDKAKATYSWLADDLDRGYTMADLFDQHRQSIAALLEVDPETIDFTSPEMSQIVATTDPQGVRRSMSVTEAERYIRSTDAYDKTQGAMNRAAQFGENLIKTFGKVA